MTSVLGRSGLAIVFGATLALSATANAAGSDSSDIPSIVASPQNAAYDRAYSAAVAGRYDEAIGILNGVVGADPKHADAHNMLGFSHRKKGNYEQSFRFYGKALKLDPDHRGAHEYIGQAYLEQKNLPMAKEHLSRLDSICTWGCEEYDTLKRAVESFETGSAPSSTTYELNESQG